MGRNHEGLEETSFLLGLRKIGHRFLGVLGLGTRKLVSLGGTEY